MTRSAFHITVSVTRRVIMPPPVEMAGQGVVDRWYKLVGRCEEIMLVTRDIEWVDPYFALI